MKRSSSGSSADALAGSRAWRGSARGALDAAEELRVISRNGTGVDAIDLEACRRRGVAVLRAEGTNSRGVAELTLGLLLALARSLPFGDGCLKAGSWQRRLGTELEGKTLGIIGCGRIGRIVARFALAMEMAVIAHDPFPDTAFVPSSSFRFAPLDDLFGSADFISLHCPLREGEMPLIGREALARMKRGAYLVNTARAGLVDSDAVLEALRNGHLAGYAVDVFDCEPPPASPLLAHDRVIASPHIGAYTLESVARASRLAVENLLSALGRL